MASLSRGQDGRFSIQFIGADKKRRTVRLGKCDKRAAESTRLRVEDLLACKIQGTAPSRDLALWLAAIGAELSERLAAVGLIDGRASRLLGDFVEEYIRSRSDVEESTRVTLRINANRLIAYFGEDRALESIAAADVDRWKIRLQEQGYAQATIGRTIRRARQLFTHAVRARLIASNPCDGVKAPGQTNPERLRFIERGAIDAVMGVADREWRLIVALSRYGGLRVPSELEPLTLADIDFERNRLRITSPKTKRHAGKAERWIPLFPELRQHIEDAYETADEGEVYLVRHPCLRQRKANVNLRKGLLSLLRKAGVEPWPRLFHNLRASRQTELAASFPLHVVTAWIGNSERIANAHYLTVTDADFDRASAANSGAERCTRGAISDADSGGQKETGTTQTVDFQGVSPLDSSTVSLCHSVQVAKVGLEPTRP